MTPKRRVTGSQKDLATEPYMLRADWDRSARCLLTYVLASVSPAASAIFLFTMWL